MKRKFIEKRHPGVSVTDLPRTRTYNWSASTICTILKNKDMNEEIDASKGVTRMFPQRLRNLNNVQKLRLIWMNENQLQGNSVIETRHLQQNENHF
ncbi:hypothetical protein AVEN_163879-1 [Araneus ventricosus]|uniref:Uncharacterized protein n=1 Tax=Araneus ventricosus TaxID=182803 RepID=A0A4Y2H7E8_ARAVE|nr:hypothetical protein AVEN_163879-1 [Araneus ventricosus]